MDYLCYTGREDLTVWLHRINGEEPLIVPYWHEQPDRRVGMLSMEQRPGEGLHYVLGVALTREAMVKQLHAIEDSKPGILWFCRLPLSELVTHTDIEKIPGQTCV